MDELTPELLHGVGIVSRQARIGIRTERPMVHVEEMIGRFLFPSDRAPQVRIDCALHDERAALFEERPELRRQQRDHAIGDELVRVKTPGGR